MHLALLYVFLAGMSTTIGNLLLKASRQNFEQNSNIFLQYMSMYFISAVLFYGLGLIFFSRALDHLPVNVGYIIYAASGFAMLALSSWAIYGEKLDLIQMIGIIIIMVGVAMLSFSISD